MIDPSHMLVYELSGSNEPHTRHDQTYKFYINPSATRVLVFIGSSHTTILLHTNSSHRVANSSANWVKFITNVNNADTFTH